MKMSRVWVYLLICPVVCASAAEKPDVAYQPATLMSFHDRATGTSCRGSGTDENTGIGSTTTVETTSHCSEHTERLYVVKVGPNAYTLRLKFGKGKTALHAFLPITGLADKQSVLAGLLPGTVLLVRADESAFHVKIGKRESDYEVVAAE